MAFFPHVRHLRRRVFDRLRHARHLTPFLAAEATRLAGTAASTTVTPRSDAAAAAVGTLTFGANAGNGKVVQIGSTVYTFKTALTEAKATSVFTISAGGSVIQDGNTLVINGKTYTWQTVLTNVDGHVLIGANDTAALLNMLHAITLGTGSGSTYAAATTAHTTVTATASNATTLTIQALVVGVVGNAYTTTETSPGAWTSTVMAGGVDAIVNEVKIDGSTASNTLDNLIAAITHGSGVGSTWSTGTVAHTTVTAAAGAGDTVTVTALTAGKDGNYIATTTDVASASFGDTHLLAGSDAVVGPDMAATTHGRLTGDGPVVISSSNGVTHVPAGLDATKSYWVYKIDANHFSLAVSREHALAGIVEHFTDAGTGTITVKRSLTNEGMWDALRRNRSEAIASIADVDNFR